MLLKIIGIKSDRDNILKKTIIQKNIFNIIPHLGRYKKITLQEIIEWYKFYGYIFFLPNERQYKEGPFLDYYKLDDIRIWIEEIYSRQLNKTHPYLRTDCLDEMYKMTHELKQQNITGHISRNSIILMTTLLYNENGIVIDDKSIVKEKLHTTCAYLNYIGYPARASLPEPFYNHNWLSDIKEMGDAYRAYRKNQSNQM